MNTLKTISFDRRLSLDDSVLREADFNPYYPEIQSALNDPVIINGKNYINLASNNYLGLANDPRIKNAAKMAIDKYGVSMCGTPVASGYNDLFKEVETKLSIFLDLEKTLIYPSCYQANNGLFKVIARKDDVIIVDKEAHSSLLEGIKAAGCNIHPFLHNDLDHLEKQLKKLAVKHRHLWLLNLYFQLKAALLHLIRFMTYVVNMGQYR